MSGSPTNEDVNKCQNVLTRVWYKIWAYICVNCDASHGGVDSLVARWHVVETDRHAHIFCAHILFICCVCVCGFVCVRVGGICLYVCAWSVCMFACWPESLPANQIACMSV